MPDHSTRRSFLSRSLAGSSLVFRWFDGPTTPLRAQDPTTRLYDLLVKGGRVVDPAQDLSAPRDVAITGNRVSRVAENIPPSEALHVLDARGKIVTPGWIDIHVHVYDGVAPLGIPGRPQTVLRKVSQRLSMPAQQAPTHFRDCASTSSTSLIRGSSRCSTFPLSGRSTLSEDNPWGELLDLRYANPKLAAKTIERHRDVILGVKVRLTRNIAGDHDLKALALAREAADAVKLPLMVHIGGSASPLKDILAMTKSGDVITHSFRGGEGGILDDRGRVLPEVHKTVARGVHLDIGHGAGSFAFDTAERALAEDLLPGTISERRPPVQRQRTRCSIWPRRFRSSCTLGSPWSRPSSA